MWVNNIKGRLQDIKGLYYWRGWAIQNYIIMKLLVIYHKEHIHTLRTAVVLEWSPAACLIQGGRPSQPDTLCSHSTNLLKLQHALWTSQGKLSVSSLHFFFSVCYWCWHEDQFCAKESQLENSRRLEICRLNKQIVWNIIKKKGGTDVCLRQLPYCGMKHCPMSSL